MTLRGTTAVLMLCAALLGARSAGAAGSAPAGLHLPQTTRANFSWVVNDGKGYRWDIQHYGTVGQGSNNAYSGGMYCQVSGSSVNSGGIGWVNESGDEIEIGPYRRNTVQIHRRVKVYKDTGLARWLEIIKNLSASEITVPLRIYTSTNYRIKSFRTGTGGETFGPRDVGFVRTTTGTNAPAVMSAVAGPRAPVRPVVAVQGNTIALNYTLKIPAGKTVLLCHFESQASSAEDAAKTLAKFRAIHALKDLPDSVRRMILNWRVSGGLHAIDLDRVTSADVVVEANGDRKLGTVENRSFALATLLGDITVPAENVLGMVRLPGAANAVRVAMVGGQVLSGTMPETRLALTLSVGGTLHVPIRRIRQWSYRITPSRPQEAADAGPTVSLRTGDRLAFDPTGVVLSFQTRHGRLKLAAADLQRIEMAPPGHGVHRAVFRNGTTLAGMVAQQQVDLKLALGKPASIDRDMILSLVFAAEASDDASSAHVTLSNGDELFGKLLAEKLTVTSDYGTPSLAPRNVRSIVFEPEQMGRVAVTIWDGSSLRGMLTPDVLDIEVAPGTVVGVHTGHIRTVAMPGALPPDDVVRTVERLVAQLGAESYKDREAARDALKKIGRGIVPLLRNRFLANPDPEIRQSLEEIVKHLGGRPVPGKAIPRKKARTQPATRQAR